MNICQRCGSAHAKIILSDEETSEQLCNDCYNQAVASETGIQVEKLPNYISVIDGQGMPRMFAVENMIVPPGIAIEATESKENGYKFSVLGDFACDQMKLFEELYKKVEAGIATTHLSETIWEGRKFTHMTADQVIGRIESDPNHDHNRPLLIIDGKAYTWEEIGKMLLTNEGFQFQLKIADMSDGFDEGE